MKKVLLLLAQAVAGAIVAMTVLGMTLTQATAALDHDTVGPASTSATSNASAAQDAVPASAGRGSATVGVATATETLPPGGTMNPEPAGLQMTGSDDGWDMGNGWWIVMVVMMVLFWGAVIAVVVWGIRQFTGDRRRDRSALDIARERLARGEITKEEFDRIRGDLV